MFADRKEAGALLAERLSRYRNQKDTLVLALPRGGVVTGFEVSRLLGLPLDIIIVRKIGFPGQPELAAGAVSETGAVVINPFAAAIKEIKALIGAETEIQKEEISRRVELYRGGGRLPSLEGRTIILVDDGAATGATIKAAITTLKEERINKLVVALPVAPPEAAGELAEMSDELICIETPRDFMAVGNHYGDFRQVSDREVIEILGKK